MSKRYGRVLTALVRAATAPQKHWRGAATRLRVANSLVQDDKIETRHGSLTLITGDPRALGYARDLETREQDTIEWIDAFQTPCTFWDIGANVGIYSLYAALRPGILVRAFEPAAASYAALCRNIEANGGKNNIDAYCIALGAQTLLGHLNMSATFQGSVYNAFESEVDQLERLLPIVFRQSVIGFSIDEFRQQFDLPAPNYLKIDVDSIEEEIIAGATETLQEPAFRSLLVELEHPETARSERIIQSLAAAGLILDRRGTFDRSSINAIFVRRGRPARAPARSVS